MTEVPLPPREVLLANLVVRFGALEARQMRRRLRKARSAQPERVYAQLVEALREPVGDALDRIVLKVMLLERRLAAILGREAPTEEDRFMAELYHAGQLPLQQVQRAIEIQICGDERTLAEILVGRDVLPRGAAAPSSTPPAEAEPTPEPPRTETGRQVIATLRQVQLAMELQQCGDPRTLTEILVSRGVLPEA